MSNRPGGRGKFRLVQATLDAASAPAFALSLDCTQIEPTPRFFLRAVTRGFGEDEAQLEPDADRLVGMFPAARRLHRRPRSEL